MTTALRLRPLLFALALFVVPAAHGARLPTVARLEDLLAEQVQLMIDAGHLRPVKCNFEQHCDAMGELGFEMDEYFTNPAELIYTLAIAIPHLPEPLKTKAKAYLKQEFHGASPATTFPPTKFIKMDGAGAHREYQDIPAEFYRNPGDPKQRAEDFGKTYGIRYAMQTADASWKGWTFNPFNLYACWKYAELFPEEAQALFDELKGKLGKLPADDAFLRTHPHVVNQYIAGYYGYLGLQSLLKQPASSEVKGWLDEALQRRVALIPTPNTDEGVPLYGVESGGFLYLVRELGDYLYQNARQKVEAVVAEQGWGAPYWHIAGAEEVSRYDPKRQYMEGYHQHLYETSAQFQARALALRWERQRLERVLDVPAVWRGDLFYLQNAVAALEAPGAPPPPPPPLPTDGGGPPPTGDGGPVAGQGDAGTSANPNQLRAGCGCGAIPATSSSGAALLLLAASWVLLRRSGRRGSYRARQAQGDS
ncbi:MAG: hypothetical protein IT371_08640 [Deltaproteobacteria bacterium]|nr:hypothetical protein [Deltaproteobacteria bacterium]